ncbi:MAG TPA: acyltransferase, partial [Candidatus Didemnitutus sp.]|nr:acyltransferase [Candidatus Didemnitutus sp.]
WVLTAHCMIWGGWYGIPVPQPKIAVDIFMLVSGFLMVFQYRARQETEPLDKPATAARFWLRRFFRIAPAYYLFLLTATVLWSSYSAGFGELQHANPERWGNLPQYTNAPKPQMDAANILMHVTFIFGLIPRYSFSTLSPDWSIGLEMQFYAVFPLLYFVLRKYSWAVISLGALALEIFIHRWFGRIPGPAPGAMGLFPEPSFLPLKLSLFVAGMLCGEAFCLNRVRLSVETGIMAIVAVILGAAHSHYVLAVVAFFLFAGLTQGREPASLEGQTMRIARHLLDNRVMRFMADVSYSVYLFHSMVISIGGAWLFRNAGFLKLAPPVRVGVLFAMVATLSYGGGWLLHRFVEQPGIKLGRRVSDRLFSKGRRPPPPPDSSVASTAPSR